MIKIRPAAAQELQRLLRRHTDDAVEPRAKAYLRLIPGGCADWTYCLNPNPSPRQPITMLDCDGICLAIPTDQLNLVKDLTIDYAEDLVGGGFRFTNPLAQRTCGCGNAFTLSADAPIATDCSLLQGPTV